MQKRWLILDDKLKNCRENKLNCHYHEKITRVNQTCKRGNF